jgi:hypothetical protein
MEHSLGPVEAHDERRSREDEDPRPEPPREDLHVRAPARAGAVAGGAVLAALIGLGAFGLLQLLPRPSLGDRIAVGVIERLDRTGGTSSVLELSRSRFVGNCRQLSRSRALVSFGPGGQARVVGTHVFVLDRDRLPTVAVTAATDLAGCPRLLANELSIALRKRDGVITAPTRYGRVAAYRLVIARRPLLELTVAQEGLRPLALRLVTRTFTGRSVLRPAPTRAAPRLAALPAQPSTSA